MNNCFVVMIYKNLVFNLEFSQGLDKTVDTQISLHFKHVGAYA
jgi:hypothetical protein